MKTLILIIMVVVIVAIPAVRAGPVSAFSLSGPSCPTPSWDQALPASTRFIVLSNFSNAAVLDLETELVWERSPSTSGFAREAAGLHCKELTTGNRLGWRLPTIQELASLVDPSAPLPGPSLPRGHPFANVQSSNYWSATEFSPTCGSWFVDFAHGVVFSCDKSDVNFVWCARGGRSVQFDFVL